MRKLATVLTITCGLLAGFAMPGFRVAGASAFGCTGFVTNQFASCVGIGGNGTNVTYLQAGEEVQSSTGGPWVGRFIVIKQGTYFLISGYHTEYHCGDPQSHCPGIWYWTWNNGGNGWMFPSGTEICGGFLTQHGDWFGGGPACKTVS